MKMFQSRASTPNLQTADSSNSKHSFLNPVSVSAVELQLNDTFLLQTSENKAETKLSLIQVQHL